MKMLICKACGGNELYESEGEYVCRFCGTRFLKWPEDRRPRPAVLFGRGRGIDDMLLRADRFWRLGMIAQAKAVYKQILEQDATCAIARKRLGGR